MNHRLNIRLDTRPTGLTRTLLAAALLATTGLAAQAHQVWLENTGGQAKLHIWGGGFHGFDMFAPDHELTRAALASRSSWLRRIFGK